MSDFFIIFLIELRVERRDRFSMGSRRRTRLSAFGASDACREEVPWRVPFLLQSCRAGCATRNLRGLFDANCFRIHELANPEKTQFATVTGGLDTAKRQPRIGTNEIIDETGTGLEKGCNPFAAFQVAC